jgi:PPOX class probable F420-dependent enzyme
MATPEEIEFLRAHKLVVVGVNRKAGGPSMTPLYYVMDGDDILMSTTASRFKAKAVKRDPNVSLCIVHQEPPFPYLMVYGKATIEEAGAVDVMMKIGAVMTGATLPDSARPAIEERARTEGRVVLRVQPREFRHTLPLGSQRRDR